MPSPPSQHKRLILSVLLKLLILLGLLIGSIPFVSSLFLADSDEDKVLKHFSAHDISALERGGIQKIKQPSFEVWVYYRTLQDIEQIKTMPHDLLRDPLSKLSQQPSDMLPEFRSLNKDYFVFVPNESLKQCQVQPDQSTSGHNGFSELCYRGFFDTAGRALTAHGSQQQKNLKVPAYQWRDEKTLLLDRRL